MFRILEIFIINYFNNKYGKTLKLDGVDKDDVLDIDEMITISPDLINEKGDLIQAISDKFGFWEKIESFDLRENKFINLMNKAKEYNTRGRKVFILAINMKNKCYQIIEVNDNITYKKVEKIKEFGYKDGYNIKIYNKKYIKF